MPGVCSPKGGWGSLLWLLQGPFQCCDPEHLCTRDVGDLQGGDKLGECNLLGLDMEFPGLWHRWPPAAPSAGAVENLSSEGCREAPRRGEEAMDAQQFLCKCTAQQR